jgi:hypothetical protein
MIRRFQDRIVYFNDENKPHRYDGPAIIYTEGSNKGKYVWYKNGLRHREDGPAIERKNGGSSYLIEGKYHRDNGPAIIDIPKKLQMWYTFGKLTKILYRSRIIVENSILDKKEYSRLYRTYCKSSQKIIKRHLENLVD